jgi:cobalt-zinc-cadmium efflux system membrane fusion protein
MRTLVGISLVTALLCACRQPPSPAVGAELPSSNITTWTDRTELYMEYPPLVSGRTVRFAVHLTRLADFKALDAGHASIEMTPESGGAPVTLPGGPPSRPGAFRGEGTLPAAGRYRWTLAVEAPGLTDRHDLGSVAVHRDEAAAIAAAETAEGGADPSTVAYLKEQQWTNPFATSRVVQGDVRVALRVPAVIAPVTGGEAVVPAPAHGRYVSSALPSIGDHVSAGQVLGRLEPRLAEGDDRATLAAAVAEAQAAVDASTAELARARHLLEERAVPARRVEDAQRAALVAQARLDAAKARLTQRDQVLGTGGGEASGNAFALRAPIAGRITEVYAALGAAYDEDAPLFRIVRTDRLELQAQVPSGDAALPRRLTGLAFEVPGRDEPIALNPDHVHDSGVIDPKTRALPVQIEVENRDGRLLVGQTGTAVIYTGDTQRLPVVPREAVLMEAGRPYVFVQIGGESFARRFVDVAARDGGVVGIRAGVKPGERVVVTGAYEIQLASAAKGLPAEGHVH